MVYWVVKDAGGMIPRKDTRLLPDNMAEDAINCDVASGPLNGLAQPSFVHDFAGTKPWPVRKGYRLPGPNPTDPDFWLALPSEFSSVCKSPLANDTLHAIYWTNPPHQPNPGTFWNTYARLVAGSADYNVGFLAPAPGLILTVTTTGGTTTLPPITRVYLFTYIDQYGYESSPSEPSLPVTGPPDATWHIAGLPLTAPIPPPTKNYPPIVKMRLYRTVTGTSTGAQYYFVADLNFGSTTYDDTILDTTVVNNNLLESVSYAPPVDGLDGLISLPGGMMVGFTGSTVHFCEPDRPHAWPVGYDQSLMYPIMGLAIWQQALIVLTSGFPSSGSGTSPKQFIFAQIQAPEPCIARGSIVTDLAGVYYASQNGLISLNYFGMQNQTLSNFTREDWLKDYNAANIVACRHRAQYLAINGTGTGFLIDYTEQRMGVMKISPCVDVVSVWNDVYTGDTYMMAEEKVYLWDDVNAPSLTYYWKSRQFYLPAPTSLGVVQISLDPSVVDPAPPEMEPCPGSGTPWLELPDGINAQFRLYAGPSDELNLILTRYLTKPSMIFKLPSGLKTFIYQFDIIARVPIHIIELASVVKELAKV